ncbi:MAG: hypothetical protein K6U80_13295 [Firmicutes bacterium]|nr:hypothetical protein [Bacillota bacterium]
MKKWPLLVMLLLCFALPSFYAGASGSAQRDATEVDDVFEPYTADNWIVSPDEEPTGDQEVNNAPECDIYGVIACYDDDYLRVDILLNNGISYELDTFYSVKFEYESTTEYYTFYIDSEELVYEKENNGKITERKTLTGKNSRDTAGVTGAGSLDAADVYLIINKQDHIRGAKGKRYYLTCTFFSGFINESNKLRIADETIKMDIEFEY